MKNRKRNRMKGFDYSSDNIYFVTICVQNRECCFGYVGTGRDLSVLHPNENDLLSAKMNLNEYGKIVAEQIVWLAEQYQYVVIHNYVVMPNHVHVIIEIDAVGTARELSVQIKIKSLSSLIGAFKTTSSKRIHKVGFSGFAWQRSFHDHIVRNERSYLNINDYIDDNPGRWAVDTFFEGYQNNSNCVG